MDARRFLLLVLPSTLAVVAAAHGLAWWLQPVYGDLARIGILAERDFGFNAPMQEFSPLAATWGGSQYERPVDVLVLGDSFANLRPHLQWQNWLAMATGWRIHTLDKHHVDLEALVASPLYRLKPPKVVIWNTIERDLRDEYTGGDARCAPYSSPSRPSPLTMQPQPATIREFARPLGRDVINPGFARTWLWKSTMRNITGLALSEVLDLQLSRSDLFTSRSAGSLLVYRRDLNKQNWRDQDLERIRCRFAAIASLFESNGKTRFVTALAPDKSSAYRSWLLNPRQLPPSRLPDLLAGFPIPDARLDLALNQTISLGTKDVYMPDDTHWGSAGHRSAAEAILHLLISQNMVRR